VERDNVSVANSLTLRNVSELMCFQVLQRQN